MTATPLPELGALDRRTVTRCDNCGSPALDVFGVSTDPAALHPVQLRCRACGLVLASPRVLPDGLRAYYRSYYAHSEGADDAALDGERRRRAGPVLAELRALAPPGSLLDVGSGTGAFLSAARESGYAVTGLEPSDDGVRWARERYGLEVQQASLEEADLPEAAFDVVRAWHVIEHVFDLDAFVAAVRRALRPGGILLVGTESYAYPALTLLRAARLLSGRVPPAATSTQHTFVFSAATLTDVVGRRGFETLRVDAYDELAFAERLRTTTARSSLRTLAARGVVATTEAAGRALRRGPYLRGFFVRR